MTSVVKAEDTARATSSLFCSLLTLAPPTTALVSEHNLLFLSF